MRPSLSGIQARFMFLLIIIVLSSCTQAPTSPDFRFEGTWTGFWKNYFFTYATGVPLGSSLTLTVGVDGSASAYGHRQDVYSDGTLMDEIEMHVHVMPDGAMYGYGFWRCSFTGLFGASSDGEVVGQLDAGTGTGSGNFIAEINGIVWHFPWKIERVP